MSRVGFRTIIFQVGRIDEWKLRFSPTLRITRFTWLVFYFTKKKCGDWNTDTNYCTDSRTNLKKLGYK